MTPDRCGTERPPSALAPGDRKAVEEFARFLSGDLAYNTATNEYVDPAEAEGNPAVVLGRPATRETDEQ